MNYFLTLLFTILLLLNINQDGTVYAEGNSTPQPHNFNTGLLDIPQLFQSNNIPANMFDNENNTYFDIPKGSSYTYTAVFKKPVNLTGFYMNTVQSGDANLFSMRITMSDNTTKNIFGVTGNYTGYQNLYEYNVVKIEIIRNGLNGMRMVKEVEFFGEYELQYPAVSNLIAKSSFDSVVLNWSKPIDVDLTGHIIMQNDIKIDEIDIVENYTIKNLTPETTYKFDVIAKYSDGGFSQPMPVTIKTGKAPLLPEDIFNLYVKATHERVDLSWQLPASENFKHVNIYRDTLNRSFMDMIFGVTSVKAATKIFETNGTYFNDLTVQPETKYEYLLTTTSTEGLESDGVSTTVTTPTEPEPEIVGGGYEKDPTTGDFTYYWTEPTTGDVKVMVGGRLYATVPASNGSIVIPSDDMVYTILNKPDVALVPVSESGKSGKPVKPPLNGDKESIVGVSLPFGVNDVVDTTFSFVKALGPLILLVLAIIFVPIIIDIIRKAMKKRGVHE